MSVLQPLITICGTTGVGKSKLAIELALRLSHGSHTHGWKGARIINADSMQVYSGMDVITNKVPFAEREGIEHLLMDFKEPGEQYVVGQWVQDAIQAIDETHRRNQIPIIVGGTSYWIQHLIFPNRLATTPSHEFGSRPTPDPSPELAQAISLLPPHLRDLLDMLPEQQPSAATHPDEALTLHTLLTALDPEVASRWHWRDTRKVLRSLRIIKDTGRRPSEIINEQSQTAMAPRYRTLCFWLYAEPSVLNARLDARVDDMIKQGLLDEIRSLQKVASSSVNTTPNTNAAPPASTDAHATNDYTLGIYQCIGFKEFHTYLASSCPSAKDFDNAADAMKLSTRKYAKRQVSWLRNKLLPAMYAANSAAGVNIGGGGYSAAVAPTYLLDATELGDKWISQVRDRAEATMNAFLSNHDLPDPLSLSDSARSMLSISDKPTDPTAVLHARRKITCRVCTIDETKPVMIEEGREWESHQKTKIHRRLASKMSEKVEEAQTRTGRKRARHDVQEGSAGNHRGEKRGKSGESRVESSEGESRGRRSSGTRSSGFRSRSGSDSQLSLIP
ncbi:tRNA isopentenyltransferase [Leucogyrophana mollusca]|uniref:tRNA isopentenyltransferase n=1 Tax=Leucogyrophana mollusca TaxID=85980 RepID=A0ACB8BQ05_9AGAM|nr:tRNA isopentenyltransferase [Leucogyrophana mollusca]